MDVTKEAVRSVKTDVNDLLDGNEPLPKKN